MYVQFCVYIIYAYVYTYMCMCKLYICIYVYIYIYDLVWIYYDTPEFDGIH